MPPIESVSDRSPTASMPIGTSWKMERFWLSMCAVPWLLDRSILWRIKFAFQPTADIGRSLDLCQFLVEQEFRDPRRRRDLHLQNIGLSREQHTPGPKVR